MIASSHSWEEWRHHAGGP